QNARANSATVTSTSFVTVSIIIVLIPWLLVGEGAGERPRLSSVLDCIGEDRACLADQLGYPLRFTAGTGALDQRIFEDIHDFRIREISRGWVQTKHQPCPLLTGAALIRRLACRIELQDPCLVIHGQNVLGYIGQRGASLRWLRRCLRSFGGRLGFLISDLRQTQPRSLSVALSGRPAIFTLGRLPRLTDGLPDVAPGRHLARPHRRLDSLHH